MRLEIDHATGATAATTGAAFSLASTWQTISADPILRLAIVSALAGFVGVVLRMLGALALILARRALARLAPNLAADVQREIAQSPQPQPPSKDP